MTDQHPITPPPELRRLWAQQAECVNPCDHVAWLERVAVLASQWGADRRLEAVCEYIAGPGKWFANPEHRIAEVRAAMRPKPPSLAEEALDAQQRMWNGKANHADWELIRRALERLQELENNG